MDEVLARKLLRQIKVLNFLIIFFAALFLAVFAVAGMFAYGAIKEVREARSDLTSIQREATDTLDVRDELCASDGNLGALIQNQSNICN